MAVQGGFQVGPFELDFQQGIPTPNPPGTFPCPNYVGLDWYAASYAIFTAGLAQLSPPTIVPIGNFEIVPPGTVVSQSPPAATFITIGTNIQLTVAMENLLSVTFELPRAFN